MAEGARRLGWLALIYAIGACVARFGGRLLQILSDSANVGFHGTRRAWSGDRRTRAGGIPGGATATAAAEPPARSRPRLPGPRRLRYRGDAGMDRRPGVGRLVRPPAVGMRVDRRLSAGGAEHSGKVLFASLVAASMGPATVVVSAALGGTVLERPALFATYFSSRPTRAPSPPTPAAGSSIASACG